jgi:hypothetical protein
MGSTFVFTRGRALARAAVPIAASLLLACGEELTTTGPCPELCPTERVELVDTILPQVVVNDTSLRGFVTTLESSALFAADEDSLKSLVVMRFPARPVRFFRTGGDAAGYTIGAVDSSVLEIRLLRRDTAVADSRLRIHRLAQATDSTVTYAQVLPLFDDSTVLDSVIIDSVLADSVAAGGIRIRLPLGLADSGVIVLGMAVRADAPTTLALSANAPFSTPPRLRFYVRAPEPDDTIAATLEQVPEFDTFVRDVEPEDPGTVLLVGNVPAARSLLRLDVPQNLIDSTAIARATLILRQTRPARGMAREQFRLIAVPVVRDFAGKSLLLTDTLLTASATIVAGDSGDVALEIGRILRFWGTESGDSLPRALLLQAVPEGGTLGEVSLGRADGPTPPRLLVTFVRPYAFGVP